MAHFREKVFWHTVVTLLAWGATLLSPGLLVVANTSTSTAFVTTQRRPIYTASERSTPEKCFAGNSLSSESSSFPSLTSHDGNRRRDNPTTTALGSRPRRRNSDRDEGEADRSNYHSDDGAEKEIPQLPAFGATSRGMHSSATSRAKNMTTTDATLVNRKFDLLYTCNLCDTRNVHKVTRIAYHKGVVIATCRGCAVQHLIADNLGFTKLWENAPHKGTIEGYFESQNEEQIDAENQANTQAVVSRVSKEVFALEKTLQHDTSSGAIVDEDGNLAME
jgi:transcription elongation factor Elf1